MIRLSGPLFDKNWKRILVLIFTYVLMTKQSLNKTRLGHGMRNRIRLLGIAILQAIPKTVVRVLGLEKCIEEITGRLWKETIIEVEGTKYALVDQESFEIINEHESFMPMWLKARKGDVFIDVGAHIGKYAIAVAKTIGNQGTVVAIEPNQENYQALKKNVELNRRENIISLNLAAWKNNDEIDLFTGHLAGHHSAKIDWKLGSAKVRAMSLDNVLKQLSIDKIDWIKIDVEGAEWEVLCGLRETVAKYKPKIVAEISHENRNKFKELLERQGYGMIKISPESGNVIYGVFRDFGYFLFLPLVDSATANII